MAKIRLGRYRVDCYLDGKRDVGSHSLRSLNRVNYFETVEAAVDDWLATGWGYERELSGGVAEALLGEAAFVLDRKMKRIVTVITHRWPDLGESRLPVATILDVASGCTRTVRIEDSQQSLA